MSQRTHSPELKERLLSLMREGRSASELARQFEPSPTTLRSWEKADLESHGSLEKDESNDEKIKRLERKITILEEDKAILEKAAAWFAADRNGRGRSS